MNHFVGRLLVAAALTFGAITATAPPSVNAQAFNYVHWVGEFDDNSDLEHYGDWVLDSVGVNPENRGDRKPPGYLFTELDMVWLLLTQEEANQANALVGQAPLVAAEATSIVSLPRPVDDTSGTLAAPGQGGRQYVPPGMDRIGVPHWDRTPTMNGIRVAVIDTGIDARHDDLNVVDGFNCTMDTRGPDGWDMDPHGHGTHVAGTIGAADNDGFVSSPAPGVALLSEVTFDATGSASGATVLCALNKALEHDADVISASLGGPSTATRCGGASVYTNAWCKAAQRAVVVVAAGNDALDAITKAPANVPGVVTVGAIVDFDGQPGTEGIGHPGCGLGHGDDTLAIFSNWGSTVDVVAPGGCILSTLPANSWGYSSGTSMATPHVSGVFANFLVRYSGCTGQRAVAAVLGYAERFENDYDGWPGADAPPLIRYVEPDRAVSTDPDADPCKVPQS